MNAISLQTYTNYSAYMNKENLSSIMKQAPLSSEIMEVEKIKKVEEVSKSKILSNEEAVALYYTHQGAQLMKSRVNILLDAPYEEKDIASLSYKDISELNKKLHAKEYLENYKDEYARIQNNKSTLEVWA